MRFLIPLFLAALTLAAEPAITTLDPWLSEATGELVAREAIRPEGVSSGNTFETVIYLKNLASPRVGRDSDESIIGSFLNEEMLVITLDYAGHPQARVPYLNRDLLNIRDNILDDQVDGEATRFPTEHRMDEARIFIVPEGCRLKRDVEFMNEAGTIYELDIIYPANPVMPSGTLLQFSADNNNRMGNFSMVVTHDTILSAMASEGYAAAMADHPVKGGYNGIDPMAQSAMRVRAAVRAVRAQAGALKLNERVATLGFSRGSGVALMAVTTQREETWRFYYTQKDYFLFTEAEINKGTYPTESADVQGAVIMSGRFTYTNLLETDSQMDDYIANWGQLEDNYDRWAYMGALDFLDFDPGYRLFLTINKDGPDAHHQMDVLRHRLTRLGVGYTFMEDTTEPLEHRMPLQHDIVSGISEYLDEVLNQSAGPVVKHLQLEPRFLSDGIIQWRSSDPVPVYPYRVEGSSDLDQWSSLGEFQPGYTGRLSFNVDSASYPYVRVLPPVSE